MRTNDPADTTEGGDREAFQRWMMFSGGRISNNVSVGSSVMSPGAYAMSTYIQHLSSYCSNSGYAGNWKCVGPFTNAFDTLQYQGRIEHVWVDPADNNKIIAGSNSGGLWKSNNGGHSWHNISDPSGNNGLIIPGTMGINTFDVNPLNHKIIYVGMGQGAVPQNSWPYGLGIAYTKDSGTTWKLDTNFNNVTAQPIIGSNVQKLAYMPGTQKLFAIYNINNLNADVLYKPDSSSAWQDITPPGLPAGIAFNDFEFSVLSAGKVIFSSSAKSNNAKLWIFDYTQPVGSQWRSISINLPSTYYYRDTVDGVTNFSISGGDTAFMLVRARDSATNAIAPLLITTPISTASLTIVNTAAGYQYIQVSTVNPSNVYVTVHDGYNNFYRSTDGGANFPYYNTMKGATHGDARCFILYKANPTSDSDVLYGGTDGGVVEKSAGSNFFHSITGDSLCITQFYGFSNTEGDENIMTAGAQDNGGFSYIKNTSLPWVQRDYGDDYLTKFMRNGSKLSFGEENPPNMYSLDFSAGYVSKTELGFPTGTDCGEPSPPNGGPSDGCNNWIKPIAFDKDNTAFVGYNSVYKKTYGGSWQPAFTGDPMSSSVDLGNRKICAIKISDASDDTMYVAYRYPAYEDPTDPSNNTSAKLYYSVNSSATIPTWSNITPLIVKDFRINDIEIDPRHTNRIWVSVGNIDWGNIYTAPSSMVNRVLYSNDFGHTWQDVSTGLSPLSVNKIVYQKGSDDVLFAATDIGVYRWNKSTQAWECFNSGLPGCIVTDLDFNYCAGKLRIATFGRGIWETPLNNTNKVTGFEDSITSNPIWTQELYKSGSIYVSPGHTLTLQNMTLHMPKNGRIAVAPGGKLVVSNSVITNDCSACFWQGIEAWGKTSFPQTSAANQGTVIIKTGSVIQHANVAVSNWNSSDSTTSLTSTGGIIQATNSSFINNHRAVSFYEYHNIAPWGGGTLLPNQSGFGNCIFSVDTNYKGDAIGYPFLDQADLYKVEGVGFAGCTFRNGKLYGTGIYSYNAGFNLYNYVPPGLIGAGSPNTFAGLTYGVDAEGDINSNPTISIDNASFDTCTVGVLVAHDDNVSTTRCNFTIGNGPSAMQVIGGGPCYQNIGIYEKNINGFQIEGNTFSGNGSTTVSNYGVVIQNTNKETKVYRNTFNSLRYACYAIDRNNTVYLGGRPHGLQFNCNTYTSNACDIFVSPTDPNDALQTIGDQGSSAIDAGNTFTTPPGHIINNNTRLSIYYFWNGTSHNPGTVTNVSLLSATSASGCSSSFGTHSTGTVVLLPTVLTATKGNFLTAKSGWNSSLASFTAQLDNGNTPSLLGLVNASSSADSTSLYNTLLGYSPYVSDTVLRTVGAFSKLPYTKYVTILCHNPEVCRSSNLLTYLGASIPYPVQTIDIAKLRDTSHTETARTTLESNMADYHSDMYTNADKLLMAMKTDTATSYRFMDTGSTSAVIDSTRLYVNWDSIAPLLTSVGELWAQYPLSGFYFANGDITNAQVALNNVSGYTLSTAQANEYSHYQTVWAVLDSLHASGRTSAQLTTGEITSLTTIANPFTYDNGSVMASLILGSYPVGPPGPVFKLPCPYEYPMSSPYKASHPINNQTQNEQVSVYPNPAKDAVTFTYELNPRATDIRLIVINIAGEKVMERTISNTQGNIIWNTEQLPSGIYIYKFSTNAGIVKLGKLTISK
ncbi:MAG: T9SS type A sorting domain-containing protein [Taibaiella sp.]|nr:T9SS type A sorting domain-containing protein [Taibaiella sp.]